VALLVRRRSLSLLAGVLILAAFVSCGDATDAQPVTREAAEHALAGGPDGTPDRPTGEVKIGTPTSPDPIKSRPLTPVEVAEGASFGRVAVLPPGAVPSYDWYNHADKAEGEIELPPLLVDDPNVTRLGLSLHEVSPPTGFDITGRQVTAVVRADGTARLFAEGVTLTSPDFWPINMEIYSIKDGRNAETVAPAGGGPSELSVYDANGIPVLIEHGAPSSRLQPVLRAAFVIGSDYVIVNAGPLPVEILTDLLDRFVAENSR
jgi:hypothetical protein